ncbi:MAG: hypothetical protein AAGA18_13065 [Verrucomicrobiota bacterium]
MRINSLLTILSCGLTLSEMLTGTPRLELGPYNRLEIANSQGEIVQTLDPGEVRQELTVDDIHFICSHGLNLSDTPITIIYSSSKQTTPYTLNIYGCFVQLHEKSVLTVSKSSTGLTLQAGNVGKVTLANNTVLPPGKSITYSGQGSFVQEASPLFPSFSGEINPSPQSKKTNKVSKKKVAQTKPQKVVTKAQQRPTAVNKDKSQPAPIRSVPHGVANFSPKIARVDGQAWISSSNRPNQETPITESSSISGNVIRTGPNSTVYLIPFPQCLLLIDQDTTILIRELIYDPEELEITSIAHIDVLKGNVYSSLQGLDPNKVDLRIIQNTVN